MRQIIFLFITVILASVLITSCSSPNPNAKTYIEKSSSEQTTGTDEIVDVTNQNAGAIPSSKTEPAKEQTENQLKKTVSPSNYPQCIDQFAAAKKVWEKMAELKKNYGDSPFLFSIGNRVAINGTPLQEMGAKSNPVPLFETWDASKLEGIDQITSLVANGSTVEILSIRSSNEGNWYYVKMTDSGLDVIKGWVPEKLVSKLQSVPSDNLGTLPQNRGGGRGRGGSGGQGT